MTELEIAENRQQDARARLFQRLEDLTAEEGHSWGVFNQLHARDALLPAATSLAL